MIEYFSEHDDIEYVYNKTKYDYEQHKSNLQKLSTKTESKLTKIANIKLKLWSNDIIKFVEIFSQYTNVQLNNIDLFKDNKKNSITYDDLVNTIIIQSNYTTSHSLYNISTLGTDAFLTIAAYGTANALLPRQNWEKDLGGGFKISSDVNLDNLGDAMCNALLAGIIILPIILIGEAIQDRRDEKQRAKLLQYQEEVNAACAEFQKAEDALLSICNFCTGYLNLIEQISECFSIMLEMMGNISTRYTHVSDDKIDFSSLTLNEQQIFHQSWLMVQLIYHILSQPLLSEPNKLNNVIKKEMTLYKNTFTKISDSFKQLEKEIVQIKSNLFNSINELRRASDRQNEYKKITSSTTMTMGKRRIDVCNNIIAPHINRLCCFRNLNLKNTFDNNCDNQKCDTDIFIETKSLFSTLSNICKNTEFSNTMLMEIGAFGLSNDTLLQQHTHSFIRWISNTMSSDEQQTYSINGISDNYLNMINNKVRSISNLESLSTSKDIYNSVNDYTNRIFQLTHEYNTINSNFNNALLQIHSINRYMEPLTCKVDDIIHRQSSNQTDAICFTELTLEQQTIINYYWNLTKLQLNIVISPIIDDNGFFCHNFKKTYLNAINDSSNLKTKSKHFKGEMQSITNLLWHSKSIAWFIICATLCCLYICTSIAHAYYSDYAHLLEIIPALFLISSILLKKMSAYKKCIYNIVCCILGSVIFIILVISIFEVF